MDMPYQDVPVKSSAGFSAWGNRLGLITADLMGFAVAFIISRTILHFIEGDNPDFLLWAESVSGKARIWSFLFLAIAAVTWFWVHLRHYTYRKPFWNELREIITVVLALAVADLALVALSKWQLSRSYWVLIWSCTVVFVPLFRAWMKRFLMKMGMWAWPSLIIGCGENAREAYHALQSEQQMGFDVIGFVAPDSSCVKSPVDNLPLIHSDIGSLIEMNRAAKYFIAVEYEQRDLRDNWLRELTQLGIRNISVIPTLRGVPLYGTDISHFFSHEVLMLCVRNNLARNSAKWLKRIFDIVGSTALLALLSPLLFYIGWKVSRDGGSPIYGHERIGCNGRKFKCLKFRSMVINSKEVLEHLLATDPQAKAEWDKDFKLKNDPRITSIGHFIRKTSLDELPQLWNVFKGEMSLVGPRPVVEEELNRYGKSKEYYLMTNPGMTGLWQVSGRNDTDYATRVYLDAWYVKNWSLWYDIAILFKTINVVLKRDGAY